MSETARGLPPFSDREGSEKQGDLTAAWGEGRYPLDAVQRIVAQAGEAQPAALLDGAVTAHPDLAEFQKALEPYGARQSLVPSLESRIKQAHDP